MRRRARCNHITCHVGTGRSLHEFEPSFGAMAQATGTPSATGNRMGFWAENRHELDVEGSLAIALSGFRDVSARREAQRGRFAVREDLNRTDAGCCRDVEACAL
jgi:hypothetical protein